MGLLAQPSSPLQFSIQFSPVHFENLASFSTTSKTTKLKLSSICNQTLSCTSCRRPFSPFGCNANVKQEHKGSFLVHSVGFNSLVGHIDGYIGSKAHKRSYLAECRAAVVLGFLDVVNSGRHEAHHGSRNPKKFHSWHHHRRKGRPEWSTVYGSFHSQGRSFRNEGLSPLVNAQYWHPLTPFGRPRFGDNGGAFLRRIHRYCIPPNSRDTPPKRDTGIASEQDWGISLKNQPNNESGLNEDGSTWYRESGEDLGDNGYRCRWTVMGGRNADGSVEWKETWWEKSDWTGYKELGAEKSGRNAQGDSWWETWQEIFRQDEWSGLARIEKSAHKQAKSRTGGVWNEKWWEKYNAKGWTEKGAHKYGRLNDQSWWEKWGEQYDGRGAVIKWTDKWAESDSGTKWGDKWEERFNKGPGTRQGETWHVSPTGERWSRTWGEEHFGNGEVHKYGRSTSGELWDARVEEATYYEAEPHYGWAEAVANSLQLLAIEIRDKTAAGAVDAPMPPPVAPETTDSSSVDS